MLGGVGEKSLRYILEYAQRVAEKCLPPDSNAIQKMAGDITAMTNALCELRQEGKVSFNDFQIFVIFFLHIFNFRVYNVLTVFRVCVYIKCL